ncbi:dihydrolipoamide acetyltransferase [Erythrobacter longus]|uniref:Dihydrolipoamide acetyltransferase n=2 Tax=Erythrobacter longus TaxID=1044 RepID=A0A074M9I5_ERYLO|nr:dihydrolipoamide acetyltransferase [Erythrobacter longus]
MMPNFLQKPLRSDENGATLVEFAIVAPVLMMVIMGIFDMGHTQYTSALMNGAMQKAGRDLTLQSAGATESAVDAAVVNQVTSVVPASAEIELVKLSHYEFEDIGEEEEYTDDNGDGECNNNEPFIDYNNNGVWDDNRGTAGLGGAKDAVLYTVNVSYDRLFPMAGLAGLPEKVELSASTVLRNQPYAEQVIVLSQGNCS